MVLLAGGYDVSVADLTTIAEQHSIPVTETHVMAANVAQVLRKTDPRLKHGLRMYRKPSGERAFLLLTRNSEQGDKNYQYDETSYDREIKEQFVLRGNLKDPVMPFVTIVNTWTKRY
jgi:hypothetical protein